MHVLNGATDLSHNNADIEQFLADATTEAPKNRKRGLRNTLIVLGSLVLIAAIALGVVYALAANQYNDVEKISIEQDESWERPAPVEATRGEAAPINIMLLGSDSRNTTDTDISIDELRGFRSDAILVVQISADRQQVTFMSIMRDNWVNIQGHGEAKINAAVAYGGIPLAVNTVENFIDTRIDHVALIDFESFKGLTDALGGVTVNNTIAFDSINGGQGFSFGEGEITLSGDEALAFVRERYAFRDGDYQRVRNQQAYMKGLARTILSAETLSSPQKVMSTFEALKPYLIVDDELGLTDAVSLALELRDVRSDDMTFFTSPTLGTGTSADGQSIVVPDWESLEGVREAFRSGTLHEVAATQ